ncbi:transcriptional regulator, LacI family [Nonlabens sp. Hel1_33_55]|uniref:LacI family DNA-binding transcriptional regulator n=1 Tax=Nonlabens sp. Hel1_33_55 TaxID=1336802 RepID=UPI000875C427|nr:LacI family DNA-binding transcriptional regulator [Nonlabens sp. Hel1_33_55]SCY01017.1 transcriptional regulator, LacI family [Nonlabens sp. Hel1_33_55]
MKKNKVTLSLLAEKLGLSISTISKSLKNSHEISEETKQLVVNTARKMGYKGTVEHPKAHKIIAVVIPDVVNGFFAQVLTGIEQIASENDYKIMTCLTNDSMEKEASFIESLLNDSIDGFIVAVAEETQVAASYNHFKKVLDRKIPLVMFDRVVDELECDKITNDDLLSGIRVVEFLAGKGDKQLCMISGISKLSVGKLREEGIRRQVAQYDDVLLNVITNINEKQLDERLEDALKYDGIDAIIALDQMAGILALNKAKELGINIPKDLQIVCYSNVVTSEYSFPKMTVVDQHAIEMGNKTFTRLRNLINNLEDVKVTRVHTLKTSLLERGTTRK